MRLLALLLLAASPPPAEALSPSDASPPAHQEARSPELLHQPARARPGDPVLVTLRGGAGVPTGTLGERALQFYPIEGGYRAVSALPVETAPGPLEVVVTPPGGPPLRSSLRVVEPNWPARALRVASRFTRPSPGLKQRMEEDRAAFARAYGQPFTPPRFTRNFAWPRRSAITARFGDRRTFNGETQTQHYGLDLNGRPGDPIRAANDGVVVLVRDCFASGNTVVVDHGAGLYTAYFHLTRFAVEEGQEVKRGDLLGTVGRTGRVTGPHLHWSARVDGLYVDPETLLKLDFR